MYKYLFVFLWTLNLFAQDNLTAQPNRFKRDLSKLDVDIYFAPLKFQTLYNLRDLTYGFKITNFKDSKKNLKYEVYLDYEFNGSKVYDPFSNQEVTLGNQKSELLFDINKFYKNWSYFLMARFNRSRYGEIHPIKRRIGWGFLGIKYDFYESKRVSDLSLSYIPLFENEVNEVLIDGRVNEGHVDQLRHSFRLRFKVNLTKNISLTEQFFYRPLYNYQDNKHDFKDNLLENVLKIDYKATDRLKLSTKGTYTYDIRQKRLYGFKPNNFELEFFVDYKLRLEFLEDWKKSVRDTIRKPFKE